MICVIRHGETDWNAIGRLQGHEDIPLNENGKLQAEQCGLALNSLLNDGRKWEVVVTSPLMRAKQTAEIIAGILNIEEIVVDDGLIERDYGKASGLMRDEWRNVYPDGKFEGAEEWDVLRDRVYSAVVKNFDKFSPKDIIIVSHGGAINAILAEVSGHTIGSGKTHLKNACISMLMCNEGRLEVVFYNKTWDELVV